MAHLSGSSGSVQYGGADTDLANVSQWSIAPAITSAQRATSSTGGWKGTVVGTRSAGGKITVIQQDGQSNPDPIILGGSYAAKLHIDDSGSNYYSGTIVITGMGELTVDIDEGGEVSQEYNYMFNGAVTSNGNVPALSA